MNSDEARQRAEESFKKEDRTRDGQKTLAEYEARALTIREKTARLKALRLAKCPSGEFLNQVNQL